MKKLLLAYLTILLLVGCSKTRGSWDYPISINSTEAEVKEVLGFPEEENFFRSTYWYYKTNGISFAFNVDEKVKEINFKGNYVYGGEDWSTYDGKILNGVDLGMDIGKVIGRLGKDYEVDESSKESGHLLYVWHKDGFDVSFDVWHEDYVEDDTTYPQGSIKWLTINKTLTKAEEQEAKAAMEDFYSKYNVLHKNELFGKELYLNDKKIGEFQTSNIFAYGSNGDYYYMLDSSINDRNCAGEVLTQIEKPSQLNEWCVYHKDNEYVATEQPYIVTDDIVVYTKCLEAKYFAVLDMNACSQYGLFVNDKRIDLLESELNYLGKEIPVGYFEQFRLVDNKILYDKDGGQFMLYDLKNRDSKIIDGSYLKNDEIELYEVEDVDMSEDELAYVIRTPTSINGGWNNDYTLYYNGKTYDDTYSFRLIDGDLYYVKRFLKKQLEYTSIYEASLIKNDLKIADFYMEGADPLDYDPFLIKEAQNCLPKTEICIYDDKNFGILSLDYDPYNENEHDIYGTINLINGKPVLSSELESIFYVYPAIEDKVVRYLLLGDTFGGNYYVRSSDMDFDYKLYKGDYPMVVYKK